MLRCLEPGALWEPARLRLGEELQFLGVAAILRRFRSLSDSQGGTRCLRVFGCGMPQKHGFPKVLQRLQKAAKVATVVVDS